MTSRPTLRSCLSKTETESPQTGNNYLAGASGGTFDVAISDQWPIDEALPPFNRVVAQKWWEDN